MSDEATAPTQVTVLPRDERGRFPRGVSGNPLGRPRKADIVEAKQTMELALRGDVDVDDLKKVVKQVVKQAKKGDMKAAKLILEFFISKARDGEEAPDAARTYVFKIEKALIETSPQDDRDIAITVLPPEE